MGWGGANLGIGFISWSDESRLSRNGDRSGDAGDWIQASRCVNNDSFCKIERESQKSEWILTILLLESMAALMQGVSFERSFEQPC